jgi:hypothetical protein
MAKKTRARQGKPVTTKAREMDERELDKVAGGFNPQPDPPGRQLLQQQSINPASQGLLLPAVLPISKG